MNSDGEIKSFVDEFSAKKAGFDVNLTDKEASVLKKKSKAKRISFYEREKIKMMIFNKAVAYKVKKDKLYKRKRNKLAKISRKINRR